MKITTKKNKTIKEANKKNTTFIVFNIAIVVFSLIFFITSKLSCDDWFMFSYAKDIMTNGFYPGFDKFAMHPTIYLTYQKWLCCIVFYLAYTWTGSYGLKILCWLVYLATAYVIEKIWIETIEDKNKAAFWTACSTILMWRFLVTRPQLWTYLFLALELLIIVKYIKTKEKKNLWIIPVLSFLEMQFHSTNWPIILCFLMPFLVPDILKDNKRLKYERKPLWIVFIASFLVGFINPYFAESIVYLVDSLRVKELSIICNECTPSLIYISVNVFVLMIYLFKSAKEKDFSLDKFCLLMGATILTFMARRNSPFMVIATPWIVGSYLKNVEIKHSWILIFPMIVFLRIPIEYNVQQQIDEDKYVEMLNYVLENDNDNEITALSLTGQEQCIANYVSDGRIKLFFDNRTEIFSDIINKDHNYLNDYLNTDNYELCKEYKIDYLMLKGSEDKIDVNYIKENFEAIGVEADAVFHKDKLTAIKLKY